MKSETILKIKIKNLDIAESYFKGKAEFEGKEYSINLQGHWTEKLIKLPFAVPNTKKVLARLSGAGDAYVEEYLTYKGKSEWIEIDSEKILHYLGDNQDKLNTLELVLSN